MKPVQIPSFISIGTTDIELREFKEKKNNNTDKVGMFSSNLKRKWYYSEIFLTKFCFDMFHAETECKNLNFLMYNIWREYKYH